MKNIIGWKTQKLEDIIDINPRSEKLDDDTEVTFLGMADVSNEGRILSRNTKVYSEVSKGFTSFKEDDVLLAKITPCFENGKRALATGLANGYGYGSTEFHVLRGNQRLIPEYIYHYVSMYDFMTRGEANMTGSAGQKRVPTDFVKTYEIPVPPLPEQKKIAKILSTVDGHIDEIDGMIEDLKELKKGLMQKLLTEGIGHTEFKDSEVGRIPVEWEVKKLGNICDIVTGSTPKKSESKYYGNSIMWASPADLGESKYIKSTKNMLSYEGFDKCRKLPRGSILVTCIGSTIGKIGIADKEMSTNQQINAVVCKHDLNVDYMYYAIDYNFRRYKDFISHQAVPIINKTTFSGFEIGIPSIQEQSKIGAILSKLDYRIELFTIESDDLKLMKKGLMQQLLTGKKRVIVNE